MGKKKYVKNCNFHLLCTSIALHETVLSDSGVKKVSIGTSRRLFQKSRGILPSTIDNMSKYVTASRTRVGKGDFSPISPQLL